MLHLVRHAEAGDKRAWDGPDAQRPLTAAGRRQANELVAAFSAHTLHAIVSSPTARCLQTVEPLARRHGLTVRTSALLTVDADPDDAVARVLDGGGEHIVWCSHGELIGELLTRLRERGAPIDGAAAWPKGSTWRLEVVGGSVTRASYVAPPGT